MTEERRHGRPPSGGLQAANVRRGWNADIRNYYSLRGFARCHDNAPRAKAGDRPLISKRHGPLFVGKDI